MKHFYYGCFKIPSDHSNICVISGLASAHSLFLFKSRFPWLGWDEFWAACPLHIGYHVLRPWPDGPGGAAIQLHIELLWPGSHRRTALPPPPASTSVPPRPAHHSCLVPCCTPEACLVSAGSGVIRFPLCSAGSREGRAPLLPVPALMCFITPREGGSSAPRKPHTQSPASL